MMEPTAALALLGSVGCSGAVGQGARVIVGLKKDWEAASKDSRTKELADREEELHQRIRDLVALERDVDKKVVEAKAAPATTGATQGGQATPSQATVLPALLAEKERLSREKELLLREKAMVLAQRVDRRWFSGTELLTSLLIAFVIGAIAGVLAGMSLVESETGIDQKTMLTIAGAGYAGTDFIEGFMKSNLPAK